MANPEYSRILSGRPKTGSAFMRDDMIPVLNNASEYPALSCYFSIPANEDVSDSMVFRCNSDFFSNIEIGLQLLNSEFFELFLFELPHLIRIYQDRV